MLISKALAKALSTQVGNEFGASFQYVMMASYFEREALPNLAARFYAQAEEEKMHAMKIARYVTGAGGVLQIPAVPAGQATFKSVEEAIQKALEWELTVTKQINGLVAQAMKENDHLAQNFLQWFVNEQLEEVSTMEMLLVNVRRAGNDLLRIDEFVGRLGKAAAGGGEATAT